MNKKALELSINAIVVLIIAMVLLGLGVYFIRNTIESSRFKAEAAVKGAEVKANPTKDNPVALNPPSIELRKNEQGRVFLYFLNPDKITNYCSLAIYDPNSDLVDDSSSKFKDSIVYAARAVGIEPNEIETWTIAIDTGVSEFTAGNQYMFTNMIYCSDKITIEGIMAITPEKRALAIANNPGIEGRFQKNLLVKIKK